MFDRKWFNRLYFTWIRSVYENDPELAMKLDYENISKLGKIMAKEIKEQIPESENKIDYVYTALKESHWFQEDVELVEKSDNELILQTNSCSFQIGWKKREGELFDCVKSHKAFLEEFCKELDPEIKVENLVRPTDDPEDDVYCKWKIYKGFS